MGLEFKTDVSPTEGRMPTRAGGVMFRSEVGPEVKEEKLYTPIPERVIEHKRPGETWPEFLERKPELKLGPTPEGEFIEFVNKYENIVGPFVRTAAPTAIPLAIAEKVTGKKLASTFDEISNSFI